MYNLRSGCSYASDFSVSTRLLSGATYNHAEAAQNGCVSEHGPTQPVPGWQFMLPSDQGITRHRGPAGLYEPAPNVSLSVAHSQFLSPAPPCYPGASTHHHALPFTEDWNSQAVTVADSHASSSIGKNRIPRIAGKIPWKSLQPGKTNELIVKRRFEFACTFV